MQPTEYGNDFMARTAIRNFDDARRQKTETEAARRERLFRIKVYLNFRKKRAVKAR